MKTRFILILLLITSSCSSLDKVKTRLKINTDAPNEFEIETREKLIIPKDFSHLPAPGKNPDIQGTPNKADVKDKLEQEILEKAGSNNKPVTDFPEEMQESGERKMLKDYYLK